MTGGNERRSKWFYWIVDADGDRREPKKNVLFLHDVDVIEAASFAAETQHDSIFLLEHMHHIGDRAEEVDGVGQVFDFETRDGIKRLRVVSRVKFVYDEVTQL